MQILIKTDVTKYLEFKAVDGSFVVENSKVEKVPITTMEAVRSPLMGLFEKRRAAKFFTCVLPPPTPPQLYVLVRQASTLALVHQKKDAIFKSSPCTDTGFRER